MSKLSEFYDNLEETRSPKIEFVREVSYALGVTEPCVRNWIKGRSKPALDEHIEFLSKRTGIPKEELFAE